jgi:hypothetical protein
VQRRRDRPRADDAAAGRLAAVICVRSSRGSQADGSNQTPHGDRRVVWDLAFAAATALAQGETVTSFDSTCRASTSWADDRLERMH